MLLDDFEEREQIAQPSPVMMPAHSSIVSNECPVRRFLLASELLVPANVAGVGLEKDVAHVQKAAWTQHTTQLGHQLALPKITRYAGQHGNKQNDVERLIRVR